VLQGTAALAVTSFLAGCPSPNPSTTLNASNPQPIPAGTPTLATVTVASAAAGTMPTLFTGLSYEKSSMNNSTAYLWQYLPPSGSTSTTVNNALGQLFNRLTNSSAQNSLGLIAGSGGLLRVGGLTVDQNYYTSSGKGKTPNQIAQADIDALAQFAAGTGWQVIYGINLGGALTGASYPTTTTLAAQEVAYVLQSFAQKGALTPWFELGNEPDNYGTLYNVSGWSLTQFETLWTQYVQAILNYSYVNSSNVTVTPNTGAIFTGPATSSNGVSWATQFATYAQTLFTTTLKIPNQFKLLTQHYYRAAVSSSSATAANLITADSTLPGNLSALKTAAAAAGVPFRLSETNSYSVPTAGSAGISGVTNGYCSALWAIDHIFTSALGGAGGVNFHNSLDSANGFQPITDAAGVVTGINPEYYGILLANLAGTGNLLGTTVSAGSLTDVTAYAVQTSSGGINVIINNKDLTSNLQVTLTLPQTLNSGAVLAMNQSTVGVSGPTLTATSGVTVGGNPSTGVPGTTVSITGYSITASVVTFQAVNTFVAGQLVTLTGFSQGIPQFPPSETTLVYFDSAQSSTGVWTAPQLTTKVVAATPTTFSIDFTQNANTPQTAVSGAGATLVAAGQVANDGTFMPSSAYTLTVSGNTVTCYVPALSAALLYLT
jgi:hypothetical protein